MMKKRIITMALAFTCVLGLNLAWAGGSRSGGTASDGGKMQLTFWGPSVSQEGIEALSKEFGATNPNIEVIPAFYSTDGVKDACKIAASSGTLPDMWYNWGGTLGGFYVENGLTYDLTGYAKANNWDKIFTPAVLNLCTLHGKVSGYPIIFSTLGMYYRKDIFEQFNLKPPASFDEFEKLCATLKQNGITPLSTGGLYGWHTMRYLDQFIEHFAGPELHDKVITFQESFDNDAIVQALAKLKEFSDKGYFPAGFITADPLGVYIDVFAGKAAMDIQTQGYDRTIIREKQDMDKFGLFPFPNDRGNRMAVWGNMIQLNGKLTEARLDACMKYLDYIYSDESTSRYPGNFTLPLPRLDARMPSDQPHLSMLRDMAARYGGFTITDQAFPTEVADVLFQVQDGLVNGQITPKQGAGMVQAAIETYLKNR
jgi:raffinose/stachyose/melibiose transport system substrate-binding protein